MREAIDIMLLYRYPQKNFIYKNRQEYKVGLWSIICGYLVDMDSVILPHIMPRDKIAGDTLVTQRDIRLFHLSLFYSQRAFKAAS